MTKLITLTEIRTENGHYVETPVLVNPIGVASVHSGKLAKPGPHLIGNEHERELRQVILATGRPIFVNETMDAILELLNQE